MSQLSTQKVFLEMPQTPMKTYLKAIMKTLKLKAAFFIIENTETLLRNKRCTDADEKLK